MPTDGERVDDDGGEGAGDAGPTPPPIDAGAAADASLGALLDLEAERELKLRVESTYRHTTHVDEAAGVFDYDCSGFVGYAMDRATPAAIAQIRSTQGKTRPLAKDFEAFFGALGAGKTGVFSRVTRALDLRPGDVVAWLEPSELASTNTGHVMIVHGAAKPNPARADEVLVLVTDASASFHGPTDTRSPAGQGLGQGTVGLLVDPSGRPVGYRWSGGYSAKTYSTTVSLGRLE